MTPLDRFLDLASIGNRNPTCSSGERAAAKMANAICEHIDKLAEIEGLIEFIRGAKRDSRLAAEMIRPPRKVRQA